MHPHYARYFSRDTLHRLCFDYNVESNHLVIHTFGFGIQLIMSSINITYIVELKMFNMHLEICCFFGFNLHLRTRIHKFCTHSQGNGKSLPKHTETMVYLTCNFNRLVHAIFLCQSICMRYVFVVYIWSDITIHCFDNMLKYSKKQPYALERFFYIYETGKRLAIYFTIFTTSWLHVFTAFEKRELYRVEFSLEVFLFLYL